MRGRYAPTRAIDAPSSVICSANATFPPRGRLFGWERPINGSISRAGAAQGAAVGRRATNPLLPVWAKGVFNLATYTEHYGLHQWESTDDFLRTDFNTDFQKIDGAIGGLLVFGSYTGNGAASQEIHLGFQPRAVLVVDSSGQMAHDGGSWPNVYGGLALRGMPSQIDASKVSLALTATGFTVYDYSASFGYIRINRADMSYYFLAVR